MGRAVEIAVYVEPGKADRAAYALDALERSMRWDERVFGLNYDLDVFNVVAVSDFNMGAMENKGLNIFNDKYVLASPQTATDGDYAGIETVIAHEYFHNWTGNRITCRDWFQLCLKEGLTVFRDQEFSSDERSRPVHRIAEVRTPARPAVPRGFGSPRPPGPSRAVPGDQHFYTATVYEKGAEIVRMIRTLIGADAFARGMALYFAQNDGTAATVEDFLDAFAQASGQDLGAFARWYAQAGTPRLTVTSQYDAAARTLRVDFGQATPPTPGQAEKSPVVMPIALGFVAADGAPVALTHERLRADGVFVLAQASDTLLFTDVAARPVPSVLRGFSAPVRLDIDLSDDDLLVLLRHDTDPFNRWQAAQSAAMRLLVTLGTRGLASSPGGRRIGVGARHASRRRGRARSRFRRACAGAAGRGGDRWRDRPRRRPRPDPRGTRGRPPGDRPRFGRTPACAAHPVDRARRLLARRRERGPALARQHGARPPGGRRPARGRAPRRRAGDSATNMTDRLAALNVVCQVPGDAREAALDRFATDFAEEPLVLDKWLAIQAAIPEDGTLERIRRLMTHPSFTFSNPNRARALIGGFAIGNQSQFHRADGAGYAFLAETVLALNGINPQIAARLLTAFGTWRNLEPGRRGLAEAALRQIADAPALSPDVADIAGRSLAG